MASPWVIDSHNLTLAAADITAIQAAIDSLDEADAADRIGVNTPNIQLEVADVVNLNNTLIAEPLATSVDGPNLFLDAQEITFLIDEETFTANEDAYNLEDEE